MAETPSNSNNLIDRFRLEFDGPEKICCECRDTLSDSELDRTIKPPGGEEDPGQNEVK